MADFFSKKPAEDPQPEADNAPVEEQPQEAPEKITVGDKSYDQDELERLVGLGQIAAEAEEKYDTKIDRVYPEFTKSRQELSELRKQAEEREQAELNAKANTQGWANLSKQEQDNIVLKELENVMGWNPRDIDRIVQEKLEARELLYDVQDFIGDAREKGLPSVTEREVLERMERTGEDVESAYRSMFPSQIKEWEKSQIESQKQPGMVTETSGGRLSQGPQPTKVTRDNLDDMVDRSLRGEI